MYGSTLRKNTSRNELPYREPCKAVPYKKLHCKMRAYIESPAILSFHSPNVRWKGDDRIKQNHQDDSKRLPSTFDNNVHLPGTRMPGQPTRELPLPKPELASQAGALLSLVPTSETEVAHPCWAREVCPIDLQQWRRLVGHRHQHQMYMFKCLLWKNLTIDLVWYQISILFWYCWLCIWFCIVLYFPL